MTRRYQLERMSSWSCVSNYMSFCMFNVVCYHFITQVLKICKMPWLCLMIVLNENECAEILAENETNAWTVWVFTNAEGENHEWEVTVSNTYTVYAMHLDYFISRYLSTCLRSHDFEYKRFWNVIHPSKALSM